MSKVLMVVGRFLLLLLISFISVGISFFFLKDNRGSCKTPFEFCNSLNSKHQEFIKIPVHFFPLVNRPTINVEIEKKKYSLLVDLGSSRPFGLQSKSLRKIQIKRSLPQTNYIKINGDVQIAPGFNIPQIDLGDNLSIKDAPIFEINPGFFHNAPVWLSIWNSFSNELEIHFINGTIGWSVFKEFCCLFDFPNSEMVLSKNKLALIRDAGCCFDGFVATPLILEKSGIFIFIETSCGRKKMMLDTGATHSFFKNSKINTYNVKEIKSDRLACDIERMNIAGHDFGDWRFWLLEISDHFECDGILGVDFFKKHSVCLDFPNQIAYINGITQHN